MHGCGIVYNCTGICFAGLVDNLLLIDLAAISTLACMHDTISRRPDSEMASAIRQVQSPVLHIIDEGSISETYIAQQPTGGAEDH